MNLRRGIQLFRGQREFHLDVIGKRRWWFTISGVLIAASVGGLFVPGLTLSIDFEGGAVLTYANEAGLSTQEVQQTMAEAGRPDAVVQLVDDEQEITVRTESLGNERTAILEALSEQAGIAPSDISIEDIGPKWGQQISAKALQGFVIFLIVVTIYITFRFEWKMSIAALAAMFHDLIITAGVYVLIGREVTPETVIAILTILGYSLYDTVVIFDKIRENTESLALVSRETYSGAVNLSLNQVFMRSVNTSLTTLLPIGALLLFGGDTLKNFAFALFVGIGAGTYSSVFFASPILALLKEREPKLTEIRERAQRREARPALQAVPAQEERELVPATAPPPRVQSRPPQVRGKKKMPRSKRKKR
jgi:preprotein translocase subunit SecF